MNREIKKYLFTTIILLFMNVIVCQGKELPIPKQNDGPGQPGLPIDSGISFLLILGAIYGVYKSRR